MQKSNIQVFNTEDGWVNTTDYNYIDLSMLLTWISNNSKTHTHTRMHTHTEKIK